MDLVKICSILIFVFIIIIFFTLSYKYQNKHKKKNKICSKLNELLNKFNKLQSEYIHKKFKSDDILSDLNSDSEYESDDE
jgi:hypothetical protein